MYKYSYIEAMQLKNISAFNIPMRGNKKTIMVIFKASELMLTCITSKIITI